MRGGARALEVSGHGGRPLPCVLYDGGGERAAVVLPGSCSAGYRLGGSPARPDLHFTRALLLDHGYDVLEAWWDADTRPVEGREAWYRHNAAAAIAAAGDGRVGLLVGRSIGTVALALLPERSAMPSVWIAPLTTYAPVRAALAAWRGPKLVVAGTADEAFEPVPHVEAVLLDGAGHGLAVGDAATSARALAGALERIARFVRGLDTP